MKLRLACIEDSQFLFNLRNDPEVRTASFNDQEVALEDHEKWLASKLSDSSARLWVVENDQGIPIGQVRVDCEGGEGVLSISLSSECRGHGLSSQAIKKASEESFGQLAIKGIRAKIKIGNIRSARVFENAGYVKVSDTKSNAIEMFLEKK